MATATQFSINLCNAIDEILVQMISGFEAQIPDRFFLRHREFLEPTESTIAVIVKRADMDKLDSVATAAGATVRFKDQPNERRLPLL